MALKIPAAEFKRFYNDPTYWPEDNGDTYHDDVLFAIDGVETSDMETEKLPDNAVVTIVYGGAVFGHGNGVGLDTYFRRWRKEQDTVYLTVAVPKDKQDAVTAAIKAAGGKVVS